MDEEKLAALRQQISDVVHATNVTETEAWQDLDALSSRTSVDTIETFEDEIRIQGDNFSGPITWYVVLEYDPRGGEDALTTSETFPGTFEGRLEDGIPIIDRMTVDTTAFYA